MGILDPATGLLTYINAGHTPTFIIGPDGAQLGIISTDEALNRARDAGLDLVEVAPNEKPPVCRIMDFGKHKFEQSKAARASRKKQAQVVLKEITMRPVIADHDLNIKLRHCREWLGEGHRVMVQVKYRGREITHQEIGQAVLQRMIQGVADVGRPEQHPILEGKILRVTLVAGKAAVRTRQDTTGTDAPVD
jgi:translation initiation factor IF-3